MGTFVLLLYDLKLLIIDSSYCSVYFASFVSWYRHRFFCLLNVSCEFVQPRLFVGKGIAKLT